MLDTRLYVSAMGFHILLLSFISMAFSEDSFHISKDKSIWLGAGEECIPATPYINAANHTPTVYSVDDLGIAIPENEDIWVGYYQVERVFEYIGCVKQSEYFSFNPVHVEIKGDPGQCFPRCTGSTVVGVTKTRCYCLGDTWNTKVNTRITKCTHQCDHPHVACGFDTANSIYSYLSVYKMNPNVDPSTINILQGFNGENNCLCLDRSTAVKQYYWQICTASLLVMCNDGDDIYIPNADSIYKTWMGAANFCFHHNYFPTNKSSSLKVKRGEGSHLWTGCFKTLVTFKHDTNISVERRHDTKWYGYLYKDQSNQLKLGFSANVTRKRVLCDKGNYEKTKNLTTKEIRSTTAAASQSNPSNRGPDVGVVVGVSVAAVLLVTALIVVFLILKRRRNIPDLCIKFAKTAKSENTEQSIPSYANVVMPPSDEISDINNVNTYSALEPQSNDSHTYDILVSGH